jgi:hypothetical protein
MLSTKNPQKIFFTAAILWAAGMAFLTVQPHAFVLWILRSPDHFPIAHMICYGFLCFLLCFYFRFRRKSFFAASALSLLVILVLGSLAEFAQMFMPDRTADIMDIWDNMVGAFIAVACFHVAARTDLFRKKPQIQLELFVLPRSTHS